MDKIKVKLTTGNPQWPVIRQTPAWSGIWNDCQFYIDDDTEECDWWVVHDGLQKKQTVICDPRHTVLITGEPSHIKRYNPEYLKQFHTIITTQKRIKAPRIISLFPQLWFVGAHYNIPEDRFDTYTKSYDELKHLPSIEKTKLISVISSNKTTTKGHRERLKFVQALKDHFKGRLDVFGSGINRISDKWDGIAPYQYHIVLENGVEENYWTEKLSDSFLAEAYPIYFGCPNIDDYFSKNALSKIDIHKPNEAITIIEKVIQEDLYNKHNRQIKEAKELVLDQYQIFPQLCKILHETPQNNREEKVPITIQPEITLKKNIMVRVGDKLARNYRSITDKPIALQ